MDITSLEAYIKAIRKDTLLLDKTYIDFIDIALRHDTDNSCYYLYKKIKDMKSLRTVIIDKIYKDGKVKKRLNIEHILDYIIMNGHNVDILLLIISKYGHKICYTELFKSLINQYGDNENNYNHIRDLYITIKMTSNTEIHKELINTLGRTCKFSNKIIFLWNYAFPNKQDIANYNCHLTSMNKEIILYLIKNKRKYYNVFNIFQTLCNVERINQSYMLCNIINFMFKFIKIKDFNTYTYHVNTSIMYNQITILNYLMKDDMYNNMKNIWSKNLYTWNKNHCTYCRIEILIYFLKKNNMSIDYSKSYLNIYIGMSYELRKLLQIIIKGCYIDAEIYTECQICLTEKSKDYGILEPCGHSGYCSVCIAKIKKCPRCRCEIDNKEDIGEGADEDEEEDEDGEG